MTAVAATIYRFGREHISTECAPPSSDEAQEDEKGNILKRIPSPLREGMLAQGYNQPTAVQSFLWDHILRGNISEQSSHSFVLTAPTGVGKTLGFLVPAIALAIVEKSRKGESVICNNLNERALRKLSPVPQPRSGYPMIMVLAPTRELVVQIHREAMAISKRRHHPAQQGDQRRCESQAMQHDSFVCEGWLESACLYGGVPIYHQTRLLERGVHLLVATPGRLIDLLRVGKVSLRDLRWAVLDEYDRLLSPPLQDQTEEILSSMGTAGVCAQGEELPRLICVSATPALWLEETVPLGLSLDTTLRLSKVTARVSSDGNILEAHQNFTRDRDGKRESKVCCSGIRRWSPLLHIDARPRIDMASTKPNTKPSLAASCDFNESIDEAHFRFLKSHLFYALPPSVQMSIDCFHGNFSPQICATAILNGLCSRHAQARENTMIRVIVFVDTRLDCEEMVSTLRVTFENNHLRPVARESREHFSYLQLKFIDSLHGGRDQPERFRALSTFGSNAYSSCPQVGSIPVHLLVATDVAARGLHINGITDVVSLTGLASTRNAELMPSRFVPSDQDVMQTMIHRIGRVGRLCSQRGGHQTRSQGFVHCVFLLPQSKAGAACSGVVECNPSTLAAARSIKTLLEANSLPIPDSLQHFIGTARAFSVTNEERRSVIEVNTKTKTPLAAMTMKASPVTEPGTQSPMVLAEDLVVHMRAVKSIKGRIHSAVRQVFSDSLVETVAAPILRLPPYVVTAVLAAAEASIDASLSRSCIFASGPRPSSYPSSTLSRIEGSKSTVKVEAKKALRASLCHHLGRPARESSKDHVNDEWQEWADDVVRLHMSLLNEVLQHLLHTEKTGGSTLSTIIFAIESEREGIGGLHGLLPALLISALSTADIKSGWNSSRRILKVVAISDKHGSHLKHTPASDKKSINDNRLESCQNQQRVNASTHHWAYHPCDCGGSCRLYERWLDLLHDACLDIQPEATSTRIDPMMHTLSTFDDLWKHHRRDRRDDLCNSPALEFRRGSLGSGSRAKALGLDIIEVCSAALIGGHAPGNSMDAVICVSKSCGLASMRAIQLFGSFRQSFGCPEQITCSFMVLGSGCLPDPTGKHKKGVYALAEHRFAVADLYRFASERSIDKPFEDFHSVITESAWFKNLAEGAGSLLLHEHSSSMDTCVPDVAVWAQKGRELFSSKAKNCTLTRQETRQRSSLHSPKLGCVAVGSARRSLLTALLVMQRPPRIAGCASDSDIAKDKFPAVMLSVKEQLLDVLARAMTGIKKAARVVEDDSLLFALDDGRLVCAKPCGSNQFVHGGYSAFHYVAAAPDRHCICFELKLWDEEKRSSIDAPTGRVAFVAFGASNGGTTMPWLPLRSMSSRQRIAPQGNEEKSSEQGKLRNVKVSTLQEPYLLSSQTIDAGHHRFDAASVDRLVVMPAFRGQGAKEILIRMGGDAFHQLGLPLRVKTASPVAHSSFLRCSLLAFQGQKNRGRCGTGRGSKEGFVHWYVGSPVVHAESMQVYEFDTGLLKSQKAAS